MTVVVIDDNRRVADFYVDMLADLGHTAHAFVDGQTALGALPVLSPELMILDRRMPGLDGLEVARRARLLRPDLLILMISASAGAHASGEAVAAGIDRFLGKPCTITQFADAVTGLIDRRS